MLKNRLKIDQNDELGDSDRMAIDDGNADAAFIGTLSLRLVIIVVSKKYFRVGCNYLYRREEKKKEMKNYRVILDTDSVYLSR